MLFNEMARIFRRVSFSPKFRRPAIVAILAALVLAAAGNVTGDSSRTDHDASVKAIEWPKPGSAPETVVIARGTSKVFRFDRAIERAAISDPAVCDITTIGGKDILINAKEAGVVNLIVWDAEDNIATYPLESTLNVDKLKSLLLQIDPESDLTVVPFNESVAVYGTAETSLKLQQIGDASKQFNKNALNFAKLRESKQVQLEVRFAEIDRKANKDFKFDLEAISGFQAFRSLTGQTGASGVDYDNTSFTPQRGSATYTPLGLPAETFVNGFASYISDSTWIGSYIKYLEQKNILKITARPNLLAKDGEKASFIVGGEFPIPIATQENIDVEYKEFGTKLAFTPVMLDGELIRLTVDAEVSELDFTNTVSFGGFTLPSILKRNQQTVAEMHDGESMVIGGLVTQKINKIHRKMPILGDIPLVNNLFNATEFSRTDIEIIVVITPHIVRPFNMGEPKGNYDPVEVKQATRLHTSPYPDVQADAIKKMVAAGETYQEFERQQNELEMLLDRRAQIGSEPTPMSAAKAPSAAPKAKPASASAPEPAPAPKSAPATNFSHN